VMYFKESDDHFPGGTEENYKSSESVWQGSEPRIKSANSSIESRSENRVTMNFGANNAIRCHTVTLYKE
jgi:hypothetical protein